MPTLTLQVTKSDVWAVAELKRKITMNEGSVDYGDQMEISMGEYSIN